MIPPANYLVFVLHDFFLSNVNIEFSRQFHFHNTVDFKNSMFLQLL